MKRWAILVFLLTLPIFGQNTRWDNSATTTTGVGQMVPVLALPGAYINFYTGCSTLPCSTPATTYISASSSSTCPSNAQVVWQLPLSQSCSAVADSEGNFGGYFAAGAYQYTITVSGHVAGPYYFTVGAGSGPVVEVNGVPISPSSPANFVNTDSVTWSFSGDQILAIASGGSGGGCEGTLPGDNTSTNCGFGNLVGTTSTLPNPAFSTFGYTNLTNGSGDVSEIVAMGDENALSLAGPNEVVGIGNANASDFGAGDSIIGIGQDSVVGASGSPLTFDLIGIGDGAASNVGNNTDDIIAIGDGVANTVVAESNDIVAIGDGADKQCPTVTGCSGIPNPLQVTDITAIGLTAASFNQGSYVLALGGGALGSNAAGAGVGYYNSGNYNVALGTWADVANSTGGNNTVLGAYAGADGYIYPGNGGGSWGNTNHTGANNTWIGFDSGPNTTSQLSNTIALGYQAHNTQSNQMTLGNSAITQTLLFGCTTGKSIYADGSGTCYTPGGGGVTLQTNSVNNGSQTILNFETSSTNTVGLTVTPVNPSGGLEQLEITGTSYSGHAAGLTGGALGSAPYQSAANTTSFIAPPTTSGHAFVYAWQPTGSAIAPTAVDLGTYLGANVTGTSPIVATPSTLGVAISCPTCGSSSGGTAVTVNGGSSLASLNINATAPVADASFLALTPKISGANMITEAPYATTSTFGVVEPDNSTIGITAGVIHVLSSGTVTSVAQTVPTGFAVSGSPVTTSGTLGITTTGLTTNTVLKAVSGGIGNSQMTDDGTNPVKSPNGFDVVTTGGYDAEFPNNVSIGTTLQTLTCDDGTGKAVICPHTTSTSNQPVGFAVSGTGTSGNVTACNLGWCSVKFDNTSVPRDYAIESSTVDGELHDTGSTTLTSGQPNFFVWTANSGAGTAGQVRLLIADDFNASSSKGGNNPGGATTDVQYNSGGAFGGNSGFTSDTSGNVNVKTLNGFFFYPTADSSNHSANIGGALPAAQTGNANTATGVQSLTANTTGNDNTAFGFGSLNDNTTGGDNTGLGFEALTDFTSGTSGNTAVGFEAMALYTGGGFNTAVGNNALHGMTSSNGSFNVAVGGSALAGNQTGDDNVAVGDHALTANTASDITGLGNSALEANTSGTYNNAVGSDALIANTTGSDNVAIGNQAEATNTTGSDNIALGRLSDYGMNAMSESIFIGYHTGSSTNTLTNQIDIGYNVQGTASNQTNLGNSSVTSLIIYGCPTGKSVLDDGSGTCYTPSAGGSGISGLTAGFIPIAGSSTTLTGNSHIDDGVTTAATLTATEPIAVAVSGGKGGTFNATEGTAPSAVSGHDILYADSTAHCMEYSANGGSFNCLASGSSATAPTASAGTVATGSTNSDGEITGLSAATSVTITFANSGWPNNAFCVATPSVTGITPYNSSQSKTAVTFSFAALTGGLFYHCGGN